MFWSQASVNAPHHLILCNVLRNGPFTFHSVRHGRLCLSWELMAMKTHKKRNECKANAERWIVRAQEGFRAP